jgi:hypothetical protein
MFQSVALNFVLNLFFVIACPPIMQAIYPTAATLAGPPGFRNDVFNLLGGLANLKESGIILASTISTAWQTWALSKALRERVGKTDAPALSQDFSMRLFGGALFAVLASLAIYRHFATKDSETLYAFGLGALVLVGPIVWLGHDYFTQRYAALRQSLKLADSEPLPEAAISESLKLQYALYTTLSASVIMALLVWAVRDSLPPEGRTKMQMAQRALAPVLLGMGCYCVASSALMSREYEELKRLFQRKWKHQ